MTAPDLASATPIASAPRWQLILALACYILALPFEAIVLWSALQVLVAGAGHVRDPTTLRHTLGIALARAHPIPFGALAVGSLAVALAGATLHLRYRRATLGGGA